MNGTTNNPTSGVVDLGTVITSETSLSKGSTSGSGNAVTDISVSGHQITLTKNKTFLESETDPVFSASAAAGITSSDITNWNSKTNNTGTVTQVKVGTTEYNPTSGIVSLPAYPSAPGTLNTTATTAQSTNASEALSGSVTLHKIAKTGTYSDLIGTPTIPTTLDDINDGTTRALSNYVLKNDYEDDEEVIAAALNDLNDRVIDLGDYIDEKQDTLVSGTNIKTINNESLLGSGNITISAGGGGTVTDVTVGGTSVVSNGVAAVPAIPTVNNSTITVQMNGSTVDSFTTNASSAKTIDLGTVITSHQTLPTISTNVTTDKADNTKVAGAKATYDEVHPAVVSSQPAGGFAPNVLYDLGTITGTVTFTMASPSDATIINHYY